MIIEPFEQPLAYECEDRRNLVEHWWELQPTDLEGRPAGPAKLVQGRSWLKNMAVQILCRLSDTTQLGSTTVDGIPSGMSSNATPARVWSAHLTALPAGAGSADNGIVVGLSSAALDTNQFDLQSRIANGTGSNQLLYQNDVMHPLETIAGGFRIFHERLLLNQSGAPVAIEEAGIRPWANVGPSVTRWMFTRDLVSVSVPDQSGLIVKFREEFTV